MTMNCCWNLIGGILLLLCLTVVPIRTASLNPCENGQVIHSNFKTSERACCFNVLCPAGTRPVICRKDDPGSTFCQHCQKGTFRSHSTNSSDMMHCEAKTTCYNNQVARFENSRKRDTICECNTDLGYCNSVVHQHGRLPRCVKKKCSGGIHLALNCSCLSFPKEEEIGVSKKPSCNTSISICRTNQNLTTDENIKTAHRKESHSVTEGNLSQIQTDQVTVNNSSYLDSGNAVYSWYISLVILIAILMLIGVVWIRRQRSASSSHYAKCQHNDSCSGSSTSENCQVEGNDVTFNQAICVEETPEIQQDNQCRNCNEIPLHIETDVLVDKHAASSLLMSSSDKIKLTDNRCQLVESLVLSQILWSMLVSNGTMTSEIRAQVERKGAAESEINYLFIDYLQKRSHFAFETFIASLIYTKQEHLATMLDQELMAKIKGSSKKGQLLTYVRELSKSGPYCCELD